MECWAGVLKVLVNPSGGSFCRVAVSRCLSSTSKSFTVPSANAIFFCGDRVEGTNNPLIERLSDPQNIAQVLLSKFGASVNAWVIEAPIFHGPFALYTDFIPSLNTWGEPKAYDPAQFPPQLFLSYQTASAKKAISAKEKKPLPTFSLSPASSFYEPKTYVLGFSKGGTVVNQLVAELSVLELKSRTGKKPSEEVQIIPCNKESLLNSIIEIHYVDVGLNSAGAYITDHNVIERISKRLMLGAPGVRFVFHGTPRQWSDRRRVFIRNEKDRLVNILQSEAQFSGGKLKVCEKFYFADTAPSLQMHFEIIEIMDVSPVLLAF